MSKLLFEKLQLEDECIAFIILNLADVVLTALILGDGDLRGFESNPAANYWITRFGMPGMIAFKFILVASVITICQIISRYRPDLAVKVLTLGCIIVGVVICYSLSLILKHRNLALPAITSLYGF